jgi:hypothetical protein
MDISIDSLIFGESSMLYSPGHPKRPFNYDQTKVIENTIWIWNQIKRGFNPVDWYVLNLSPLKRFSSPDILNSLPDLVNRVSGAINSRAYRKGHKSRFYAALEHLDDECYGDHLHCLLEVPGGLTVVQERRLNHHIKAMRIFKDSSRAVNIRPLCPSGDFGEVVQTLHYHCKQTTNFNDPYAFHKTTKKRSILS